MHGMNVLGALAILGALAGTSGCTGPGLCGVPIDCPEGVTPSEDGSACLDAQGRRQGLAVFERPDGSCLRAWFEDGLVNGAWESTWPDGTLRSRIAYIQGAEHGAYLRYHENGQLFWEGSYWHGRRDGLWRIWSEDGRLLDEVRYDHGLRVAGGQGP